MASKVHVKKDDQVIVISGKDKGAAGKVLKVDTDKNRVYVEGANIVKKHQKARTQNDPDRLLLQTPIQKRRLRRFELL